MTTFQPVSVARLYRVIANQIKDKIRGGSYRSGERLPAERELAEMLQVSRPSVREALIALEIEGWVDVRVGSGVYVTGPESRLSLNENNAPGAPLLLDVGAADLLQARLLVEPHCAELAARHATDAQLQAMEEATLALPGSEQPSKHNDRLHLLIAEACGNAALASVCMHLWDLSERSPIFQRLDAHYVTQQDWTIAWGEHTRIVEAIVEGDAVRARHAMSYHLVAIMVRLRENPAWTA